jgi:hypothetical protein
VDIFSLNLKPRQSTNKKKRMNIAELQANIKCRDAIFRLEGFEPTGFILLTDKAVLLGVGTYAESTQELVAYIKQHKTAEGFVYSKTVGLV